MTDERKRHIMYRLDLPNDPDIQKIFRGVMVDNLGNVIFGLNEVVLHDLHMEGWGNLLGMPVIAGGTMVLGFQAVQVREPDPEFDRRFQIELGEAYRRLVSGGDKRVENAGVARAVEVRKNIRAVIRNNLNQFIESGAWRHDPIVGELETNDERSAALRELKTILEYLSK